MIVTCTECAARYRVNEEKLPPGGGNIKCPKCAHVFFVKPPAADLSDLPRRPGGANVGGLDSSTTVGAAPDDVMAKFGISREDVPYDQKPTRPTAGSLDDEPEKPAKKKSGEGVWKLKTNFGLVYDFPDTNSLRNWLSARDDLSGYQLAGEGEAFKDLIAHDAVLTAAIKNKIRKGATAAPAAAAAGSDESPYETSNFFAEDDDEELSHPSPVARNPQRARTKGKSRPGPEPIKIVAAPRETKKSNRAIYLGIVALLLVSSALALQLSGVLDLRSALFGPRAAPVVPRFEEPVTVAEPEVPKVETREPIGGGKRARPLDDNRPTTPNPFTPKTQAKALMDQAQNDLRARKFDAAIAGLKMADRLDPGNKDIYLLLERAYQRAGQRDEADKIRERIKEL
jgi:predicted Zn finger-like uncharacterized protein